MGRVYKAHQEHPIRRVVALKVIKLGMDTREIITRFESERQALAIMNHPNIAKVFDAGINSQGQPYFVMEYVPGLPITDYCDRHRLRTRERLELFRQLCSAVQHAHQKGIIHRDIKPSNVLVQVQDGVPVPKVIDFGIAKAVSQPLVERTLFTVRGVFIGTPEYMSPEQADTSCLDVDVRTDVYSLGVLLYELLVGVLPFDMGKVRRRGYDEILRVLREEEPPRPTTRIRGIGEAALEVARLRDTDLRALTRELGGDLDWIAIKALEKERSRRYSSASDFAADIVRYLAGDVVLATPPTLRYRFGKFAYKHKAPLTAALAVALLLIAALSVISGMYLKSERQRALAEWQSYKANLKAAQMQLGATNTVSAKSLLDLCEPALRGWEWRQLNFRRDSTLATLYASGEFENTVEQRPSFAFSPDSKQVFWKMKSTLHVWETASYRPLGTRYGLGDIVAVKSDGTRIITRAADPRDYTLRVFDPASGDQVAAYAKHKNRVDVASFSPDGTHIISCDGYMHMWDVASSRTTVEFKTAIYVLAVAFSPDAKRVVTASMDRIVRIWDTANGKLLAQSAQQPDRIISVVFSPDGRYVAFSSYETIQVWDSELKTAAGESLPEAGTPVIAFSPDSKLLVSGSSERLVTVWSVPGRGRVPVSTLHTSSPVNSIAFSPDGSLLLAGMNSGQVAVWDGPSLGGTAFTNFGTDQPIGFAVGKIVSRTADLQGFRFWDSLQGKPISTVHLDFRYSWASISQDGSRLAIGPDKKNQLNLFDVPSAVRLGSGAGDATKIVNVVLSPDGTKIASFRLDQSVNVSRSVPGTGISVLKGAGKVRALAFSPDNNRLAGCSTDSKAGAGASTLHLRIWEADTAKELPVQPGLPCGILRFNRDGTRLAIGGIDGGVTVVRFPEINSISRMAGADMSTASLAFHPDGERIAAGDLDGTIRIWNTKSGELLFDFKDQPGPIVKVEFSPDGTRLYSISSREGATRVWDTRPPHSSAAELVTSLFIKSPFARDVEREVRTRTGIDGTMRSDALSQVQARGDDVLQLIKNSWNVSKTPGRSPGDYRTALSWALAATEDAPWNSQAVTALGMAKYRLGAFQEVRALLAPPDARKQAPRKADLYIAAMALFRLGERDRALLLFQRAGRMAWLAGLPDEVEVSEEAESIVLPPQ